MDQFSHDLTLALEETSLMDRSCGVGRWGSRRRTRSTGNLPCAPQPTEDSSSSPTDILKSPTVTQANKNDGLNSYNITLPASDSDEKEDGTLPLRLPCKTINAAIRLGTLESDSLNETNFSPARFYKPNSRRKRKIKRMSMDFDLVNSSSSSKAALSAQNYSETSLQSSMLGTTTNATTKLTAASSAKTVRKRLMKADPHNRSNIFFCGKRKRSNRDRYHEHEHAATKTHSCSMPKFAYIEECRMRPRSFSSTSKPHSERLQPLNKGLLSKIERISQLQKTEDNSMTHEEEDHQTCNNNSYVIALTSNLLTVENIGPSRDMEDLSNFSSESTKTHLKQNINITENTKEETHNIQRCNTSYHKKFQIDNSHCNAISTTISGLQSGAVQPLRLGLFTESQFQQQKSMDCSDLNDFLSSSSLSSTSESDDEQRRPDGTDREGDDELTDWPGNEFGAGCIKYDPKRKLTKKSTLAQIRSDEMNGEDDTLMSGMELMATTTTTDTTSTAYNTFETIPQELGRYQPSEPIRINTTVNRSNLCLFNSANSNNNMGTDTSFDIDGGYNNAINNRGAQIESEMSGETSNPFLSSSSPPLQTSDVREIRAGCRRIKGERAGFSIKLSVNERLARFLQDPRQSQIRVPDIEIYEHDSLLNLATLYSLKMSLDQGCTVLTKTSNTTQSVNIEQQGLHNRGLSFSDFKRRCYDGHESVLPPK